MVRTILIATDLSDASKSALRLGLELARRLGAAVTALHVAEPPYPARPWLVPFTSSEVDLLEELGRREQREASRMLGEQIAEASADPRDAADVTVLVKGGVPAEVIVETAAELGVDLLVVGSHGRRGVKHLLLGSIAERVVRTAPCPVLTARTGL